MKRLLSLAIAALAIAGCGQPVSQSDREQAQRLWQNRQQAMLDLDSWDIRARAVVKLKAEAYNIGIRWQRENASFMMLLEAPFGQGVFRIDSNPGGGFRLRLPDGRLFVNATPEKLLEDAIGWSLPISGLEYWIRGLPRPGSDYSHRLDGAARPRSISQDRWVIDYLDYFAKPEEAELPRRIKLSRDELTLKLVIEHWRPAEVEQTPSDLFPEFD